MSRDVATRCVIIRVAKMHGRFFTRFNNASNCWKLSHCARGTVHYLLKLNHSFGVKFIVSRIVLISVTDMRIYIHGTSLIALYFREARIMLVYKLTELTKPSPTYS